MPGALNSLVVRLFLIEALFMGIVASSAGLAARLSGDGFSPLDHAGLG